MKNFVDKVFYKKSCNWKKWPILINIWWLGSTKFRQPEGEKYQGTTATVESV